MNETTILSAVIADLKRLDEYRRAESQGEDLKRALVDLLNTDRGRKKVEIDYSFVTHCDMCGEVTHVCFVCPKCGCKNTNPTENGEPNRDRDGEVFACGSCGFGFYFDEDDSTIEVSK